MTNGIKIITSVYELWQEEERSGTVYKSFPLTTLTIRDIIFEGYEYVIYTDKYTLEKFEMDKLFNYPNVKLKIQELNSDLYKNHLNPVREKKFKEGDIWERYYSVKNYVEVIFNKFKHLLEESEEGYNTFWIDAGLFGTSCNDGWRDFMVEAAHTKNFIEKINEKINLYDFICMRGNDILINIDVKTRLLEHFKTDFNIVPACLFGGKHNMIKQIFTGYEEMLKEYVQKYQELISEQEILSILTHRNNVKFYDFGDWLDLQRGFLNIMDIFEKEKYMRDSCELYTTKFLHLYKR